MKNAIKIVFIAAICAAIAFVLVRFNDRQQVQRADTFVVGMMSGWAPFMTINADGQYEGFDVDVAQEIAKRLGKALVIKDLGSLAPTFIALDQGTLDVVMSGLDITQARLQKLAMVPYAGQNITNFYLLFWNKIPQGISSIKDLVGDAATVCVEPGSGQEKFLDSCSGVVAKSLSRIEDMILDIKYGKSLAALVEPIVMMRVKKINPEIQALAVPLPKEFQVWGWGIAVKKENQTTVTAVQDIIKQLKQDGTLRLLEQKWGLEEGQV